MTNMRAESVLAGLRSRVVGRTLHVHDRATSTNDLAWRAAAEGAPDGAAVVALEQTAGRGRFGRPWHSPRGGLWMSVVLRPAIPPERLTLVPVVAALGMRDAVERLGLPEARIRFPNDVVVRDRKICGLLSEARGGVLVVGAGLNVNLEAADFTAAVRLEATSLKIERGAETPLAQAARAALEGLDEGYARLLDGADAEIAAAWRGRSSVMGRAVALIEGDRPVRGTVVDLDPVAGIVLRMASGVLRTVRAEHVADLRPDQRRADGG